MPTEREPILALMRGAAASLPRGAKGLDARAGTAPYRELFAYCEYLTSDWSASVHPGAREADIVASLAELPVEDHTFEAVLNTQCSST